ncbi:MAG: hypothetical protein AAB465_01180 [Patescibacteria group bacterium]
MKRIFPILAVVLAMFFLATSSGAAKNLFELKATGKIQTELQADGKLKVIVWPSPRDTIKNPDFSGTIIPKTKIIIIDEKTTDKKNLIRLNGKKVIAYGQFYKIGQGSKARIVYLYLLLYVQPQPQPQPPTPKTLLP